MLTDIVPQKYRRYIYAAFVAATIVVGALNAAGVGTGKATDVLTYLGGVGFAVAVANSGPPKTRGEEGLADVGLILLVVILVLCVLIYARVN